MSKSFKDLLTDYIAAHPFWAETTRRTNHYSLIATLDIVQGTPEEIYTELKKRYSKASIQTHLVLINGFLDFCVEKGKISKNELRPWCQKNLKNRAYNFKPNIPNIDFDEAQKRILKLKNQKFKRKALQLLWAGMRFSESLTYNPETETVRGKGGVERKVIVPEELRVIYMTKHEYVAFYLALRKVGLKPHDLRKIRATQLAQVLDPFTLKELFGWSSLNTAQYYVRGKSFLEIKEILSELGSKHGFLGKSA